MIRDLEGNIIPYAKTKKTIQENFILTNTLPSWLTISNTNNYSIKGINEGRGYLEVLTPTNNSAGNTTLNVFPLGINFSEIKEIQLELDSLVFDSSNLNLYISFYNSSGDGIELSDRYSTFSLIGKKNSVATTKIIPYNLRNFAGYNKRRNLNIVIRDNGTISLSEGDSVIYEYQFAQSEVGLTGVIYPKIIIATTEAIQHKMQFSSIKLSVSHN